MWMPDIVRFGGRADVVVADTSAPTDVDSDSSKARLIMLKPPPGGLTAPRTVRLLARGGGDWTLENATTQTLTVLHPFGAGVTIDVGKRMQVISNGTDLLDAHSQDKKTSFGVFTSDLGADSTGAVDATTAIQAALTASSDVFHGPGTYKIAQNVSLGDAGKSHRFVRGSTLVVAASIGLTISGHIDAAGDQQIIDLSASGATLTLGRVAASRFHAEWVGIKGDDATDNTVPLQKLIDAMPTTGGVIVFGPGRYRFSSTIDISAHTNLTFEAEGARFMQDFDNSPSALIYTGTADPAIHVHTNYARNFQCKELEITYTNAAFAGDLIRIGGDGLEGCPGCSFHHCEMGGTSTAFGAASCVSVSSSEQLILDECLIMFAQRGVYSPAASGINSGLILEKCQIGNVSRAQVELVSGTMLGPKIHKCLLDNTTILNPPYGLLIGATDFSIEDNVIAGGTADKTPTGYCVDLTGTGRFVGNMILTDLPGVVVRFGSGSVLVQGNTGYGAPPLTIQGGSVSGGGNTWYPGGRSAYATTTTALADAYTYSNGTSGAGATLTRVGNGAFPTIDTVAPVLGYRYLIKNETAGNAKYNGLYTLTALGSGSAPWALTRVADLDTSSDFVTTGLPKAIVLTFLGSTNVGKAFQYSGSAPVVGTDAISFVAYNQIAVDVSTTTADCTVDIGPDTILSQVFGQTTFVGYSYSVTPDGGSYKTCGRIKYNPAFDQSTLGPLTQKQTVRLENQAFLSSFGTDVTGAPALPKGNVGAGSDTLAAVQTIPAKALDQKGKGLRVRLWGTCAANNNGKQVQVKFAGATNILIISGTTATNNKTWSLELELVRTSDSSHQTAMAWGHFGGAAIQPQVTLMTTHDLNSNNDVSVFLTSDTASDDITLHAMTIEAIQ